jgi:O-antigen/teichoic acid export membrane protein
MLKELPINNSEKHILTIAKGGILALIGKIADGGLKYLFDIIIAIFLGSEYGGIYFLSASIILIAQSIAFFGVPMAVIRYTAIFKGKGDESRIKGSIYSSLLLGIIFSSLVTLLLYLTSNYLAQNIFHKPDIAFILKYLSLSIPFINITYILSRATRAFKGMKYEVYTICLVEPFTKISLAFLFLQKGWGIEGVIIAYITSSFVGMLLSIFYARKSFSHWHKEIAPIYQYKKIISFSFPALLIGFFSILIIKIDILILGYLSSAKEVGIYNIAAKIAYINNLIFISFNAIFSPIISELYTKNEHAKLNDLFKVQSRWILTVSLPIGLLLILFANPILNLIGQEFIIGSMCLIILSLSMILISFMASVEIMLVYSGKVYLNLLNSFAVCIISVILNFLLIPRFGIMGAAMATGISLTGISLVRLTQVTKIMRLNPLNKKMGKPLFSAMAAFLFTFLLKNMISLTGIIWLILYITMFLSSYAAILYFIGLEKEDSLIMRQVMTKLKYLNLKNADKI